MTLTTETVLEKIAAAKTRDDVVHVYAAMLGHENKRRRDAALCPGCGAVSNLSPGGGFYLCARCRTRRRVVEAPEPLDFSTVNLRILEKWSGAGLTYVKREAWKRVGFRST